MDATRFSDAHFAADYQQRNYTRVVPILLKRWRGRKDTSIYFCFCFSRVMIDKVTKIHVGCTRGLQR